MCIYYRGNGLTYKTQEHIFSAAIGGIQMLEKGMVCDQFNNDFSKIEQDLYRNGMLAMPRSILGPGKRGSLAESKATRSKVHLSQNLTHSNKFSLTYTQSGKASQIEIPHLSIDIATREQCFCLGKTVDVATVVNSFVHRGQHIESLKIRWVSESLLPVNVALIGIEDGIEENFNCFVFSHPGNPMALCKENIASIASVKLNIL